MLASTAVSAILPLITDYTFRLYPELTAENAVIWGTWGAFLLSSPFFLTSKQNRKSLQKCFNKNLRLIIIVSAITSVSAFAWWFTISKSNSGITELLGRSEVVIAFFLGIFILKEKTNFYEVLTITLAILGLTLISTLNGEINFLIAIMMILSRSLYALQSLLIKKFAPKIDGFSFGYFRIFFMGIFLTTIFGLTGKIETIPLKAVIFYSIGLTSNAAIGKMLYFQAHNYLPISKLNIFLMLQTIFVLLGSFLIFKDEISLQKILGSLLLLGGITIFYSMQNKKRFFRKKKEPLTNIQN